MHDIHEERWNYVYSYAKKYYEEHGNLLVPRAYTVHDKNGKIIRLGLWIIAQRQDFRLKRIRKNRMYLLNDLNMVWNVNMAKWVHNYSFAKEYYEKYHDLSIPQDYKIIGLEGKTVYLYSWLQDQKNDYKIGKLTHDQIDMLNSLNIKWRTYSNLSWDDYYVLLKEYYNTYGNLKIPSNYAYAIENGKKVRLDKFIQKQRTNYKLGLLSNRQIELLNDIYMVWDSSDVDKITNIWVKNYYFAKEYYEKHGHLLVDWKYVIYDDNHGVIKLGQWIVKQRQAYKNNLLSKEQISLLNDIGMVWLASQSKEDWTKYYGALVKYKDMYGDLYVNEGYMYKDEEGNIYDLYTWLNDQIGMLPYKNGTSNDKRYSLLYRLGISWNRNLNLDILERYIEDEYNKYINGKLKDNRVVKLINSGAFTYSDYDGVEKSKPSYFMNKIQNRKSYSHN